MNLTIVHVVYLMHFLTTLKKRIYDQKNNICYKLVNGKKFDKTGISCSNFCGDEVEVRGDFCSEYCRYAAYKYQYIQESY